MSLFFRALLPPAVSAPFSQACRRLCLSPPSAEDRVLWASAVNVEDSESVCAFGQAQNLATEVEKVGPSEWLCHQVRDVFR